MSINTENIYTKILSDWHNFQLRNNKLWIESIDVRHFISNFNDKDLESSIIQRMPFVEEQFSNFNKFVPDRWISKDDKENIWKQNFIKIAVSELSFIREYNRKPQSLKKLEKLENFGIKVSKNYSKTIYKGIKTDITIVNQIAAGTSKLNVLFRPEILHKLRENKINDIVNFTNMKKNDVIEKIWQIKLFNTQIVNMQHQNKEIGFWKGNFFGTNLEKQQYQNNANSIERFKNGIVNINHYFRDKIIDNNNISFLSTVHCIPKINFSENKFKDNAIMHARIEIDIKNYREQPQNSSLPKFIFDKEIDRHNISVNETQAELNRVFEFTQVPNQADWKNVEQPDQLVNEQQYYENQGENLELTQNQEFNW